MESNTAKDITGNFLHLHEENEICQNFDFYFHIIENTVFVFCAGLQCRGEVYVHP